MASIKSVIVENIIESLPVGLAVISPEGDIVAINNILADIFGYPREEFEDKGLALLFWEEAKNRELNQVLLEVIQKEKVNFTQSVYYTKPSGEKLCLAITSSFLRDQGEIVGMVLIIHDQTELFRLIQREKNLLQEQRRIQEQRAESLNKLAFSLAHQIRNPVMTIGGFASLLMKKLADHPQSHYFEVIKKESQRLEEIVGAVNEYASLPHISIQDTPLIDIVNKAQELCLSGTGTKDGDIEWEINVPEDIILRADPNLLAVAIEKIMQNAYEFKLNGKPKIGIEAVLDNSTLVLHISDNSMGIEEENIPYLFDPFYTTKSAGVGMGLWLTKRIVDEHRGTISVSSKPEKGTTVEIKLPCTKEGCQDSPVCESIVSTDGQN
jgi:PAS domain S-box-containing protein